MESDNRFAPLKKKDLVSIAVQFGLMSLSKANSLHQTQLAEFLFEQEKKSQGVVDPTPTVQYDVTKPVGEGASHKKTRKTEKAEKSTPVEKDVDNNATVTESSAEAPIAVVSSDVAPTKAKTSRRKKTDSKTDSKEEKEQQEETAENAETTKQQASAIEEINGSTEETKEAPLASDESVAAEKSPVTKTARTSKSKKTAKSDKTSDTLNKDTAPKKEKTSTRSKKTKKDDAQIQIDEVVPDAEPVKKTVSESAIEHPTSETTPVESPESTEKKHTSSAGKHTRRRTIEIRPKGQSDEEYVEPSTEEHAEDNGEIAEGEEKPIKKEPQPIEVTGILEILTDGNYGFLRHENYLPSSNDVFVHANVIRRFGLRMGDEICGVIRPKHENDKNIPLQYIKTINGVAPEDLGKRPRFEKLTPIYPDEKYTLETGKTELSTRIIDIVSPIGKGQRGMIVSPPKAGKTILLQKIANAISQNSPKTKLIVLLIDERPEEVTDMQRSIKGEVVYSTFDKKPENHTKVTELVLERAMRLVEMGEDVVILLDSMTRLARAYNLTINPTGRTLSGGLDPGSLYGPKRFFGAARNIENGGSLTIIATSLIDTGSRMDEVIFEEFKGTGNMEVYLDRKLSEKRIFPAIDINKSGTRREELLLTSTDLDAIWTIRKAFGQMDTAAVTEMIISLLLKTNNNAQFTKSVNVSFADKETFDAMRGATGNKSNN
ncbi:MAG TPA: transcription termination factor Rho [Bacillota bacterium]|nr:transcription termination factor Rho [Bacillota bacterium]